MKNILTGFCLLTIGINTFAQQELHLPLLYHWEDNSLPHNWIVQYNDCWGYADTATGKEYAILGGVRGTYFFDITDPANSYLISYQKGNDTIGLHRDFKTYGHYAYAVCDEGNSSLQIFDLQYLPDSVHKVYDSDALCIRAHNLFINNGNLYLAGHTAFGNQFYPMSVLSLADPENPTLLKNLSGQPFSYVHDVFVRNDTAFASCGGDGLYIIDFTDPVNPAIIQSITSYPEQGYNHSSWVSENGKILVMADENHGLGLKIYDISDISNPTFLSTFQSNLENVSDPKTANGSIPHNPFIVNNKVFISYYHDGVQVYDISDPAQPQQAAYYDTEPSNTDYSASYAGAWGVYPFLPSKHIIGSDIEQGLFILDGNNDYVLNVKQNTVHNYLNVSPNPANDNFKIELKSSTISNAAIEVIDISGRLIHSEKSTFKTGSNYVNIACSEWAKGIYFVKIISGDLIYSTKFVKQ